MAGVTEQVEEAGKMDNSEPKNMKLNVGKAGMDKVDVKKVNEIILKASKGSKFYTRQQERQQEIEKRIEEMKERVSKLNQIQIDSAQSKMDEMAEEMEKKRDLSQVIVCVDMDAYFAAVEMRDDPKLKEVPMAVGGMGMLSTSNYLARQFGVRAAMPGFIAKQLCPQLVIVPSNFDKYQQVSHEVQEVMAVYDPHFSAMSLDEAFLNITHLVEEQLTSGCSTKSREEVSEEIVNEIRNKIFEKTQLTCSAGIAPNGRLAKVCSNMNKPNGQFCLGFHKSKVTEFVEKLPIGKICGIGNVSEQMLQALEVKTCGDLWTQRALISLLFSPISTRTYLRVAMGLGETTTHSEVNRKSTSVERTFREESDETKLKQRIVKLSELLSEDLKAEGNVGKVVTLKLKTSSYHVRTKAHTLAFYTDSAQHISTAATQLLIQEIKAVQPLPLLLRLIGVRMSSLLSKCEAPKEQQKTLDSVFKLTPKVADPSEGVEWEYDTPEYRVDPSELTTETSFTVAADEGERWTCPVCLKLLHPDVNPNAHLDECLSKETVKEVLREENFLANASSGLKRQLCTSSSPFKNSKKKPPPHKVKPINEYFKK